MNLDNHASVTLDKEIIDEIKSYTKDNFPSVIQSFISSYATHIGNIDAALQTDQTLTISRDAHALKSTSVQIGAMKFSAIARSLELEAQISDTHTPRMECMMALRDEIKQEYNVLEPLLRNEL